MQILLLLGILATCYATPQDLSGKMFTFPQETNSACVNLLTSTTTMDSVTVCLKFFTDIKRNYGLFSLSTPSTYNDFVLFKIKDVDTMRMHARDGGADFLQLTFPANIWHSICATWTSSTGVGQLWVDGEPSSRKFVHSGQPITGKPSIILGQEQDSYGGGFDAMQSFVGMMTDVHMWNYVLSPREIQRYVSNTNFTPGNVLNWRALDFQIRGRVLVENKELDQASSTMASE